MTIIELLNTPDDREFYFTKDHMIKGVENNADNAKKLVSPLEKFARGVYDAFPRNLEEANQMFNPIELLREAGGKSGRFFESGGRDRQAGIGALIDTLTLGAGPASVGLASLFTMIIRLSNLYLNGLMSANIGIAPTSDIASEVAKYVNGVVIT